MRRRRYCQKTNTHRRHGLRYNADARRLKTSSTLTHKSPRAYVAERSKGGGGIEDEIQQKRGREWVRRAAYRETEWKNRRRKTESLLLCQQIRFGFGSPVHRITPNWNGLEGNLKRPHTTRPVHQTDKQNWILYPHTLLAVQNVDREHGAGKRGLSQGHGVGRGWKETKNYIKEAEY